MLTSIAGYLAVRHVGLPEPSASAPAPSASKGDDGGGNGKGKGKAPPTPAAGTWREVLGLPEDAETFCASPLHLYLFVSMWGVPA